MLETSFLQVRVPQSPFNLKPVSNSNCNKTTNFYRERERWLSTTNVQAYMTKHICKCITILIKLYVFWFSAPSHTGIFQRNLFCLFCSPKISLASSLVSVSLVLVVAVMPACANLQEPGFNWSHFPRGDFPPLRSLTAGITVNLGIHARRGGFVFTCSSAANLHLYFCCYTVPLIFFFYFTWNWSFTNNFTDSALVSFFLGLRRYIPLVQWVDVSVRQSQRRAYVTQWVADAFQPF